MQTKVKAIFSLLCVFVLLIALNGCGGRGQRAPSEQMPLLLQSSPPEAEALSRQAQQDYSAGKVPQAIGLWERIVQKYPNTPAAAAALNRIGEIHLAQGQYDKALQFFDYLIYAYPGWDGIGSARLNMLKLQAQTGKKKQVQREAVNVWDSTNDPKVRLGLAELMMGLYSDEGDLEAAFDWCSSAFTVASTPEEKRSLTAQTLKVLERADERTVKSLYKKKLSNFMKVFLDYRLAEIEAQKGGSEVMRERLNAALAQEPGHPLASQLKVKRGTAGTAGPAGTATTGPSAAKPPVKGAAAARPDIPLNANRIGVLLPLNGPNAKYGDMVVRGLNMAVSDWNEKYPDQQVALDIKDTGTGNETIEASFQELVKQNGVLAVIGPLGIQAAKTVMPLAANYGVPLLTLAQKEDDAEQPYVLHVFIDSRELVRSLVKYCREKLKYERFACIFPDDRYGQRLSKIFSEVVKEQGGNVIASASYKEKSTDFNEPLQKLMNIAKKNAPLSAVEGTPFEALFIPDQVQSVALLAPQLPYNNIVGVTLLGTNLWSEAPLVQAGGVYVEQALFATGFFPDSQNPRVKSFRERYEALYSSSPSYLEAQSYDALVLLLQSKRAVRGEPTREAVFQTVSMAKDFKGVAGTYTVSSKGDLDRQYTILQVTNGKLVQVSPSP